MEKPWRCDACAGEAENPKCMCGGSGLAVDAVQYLRQRLFDGENLSTLVGRLEDVIEQLTGTMTFLKNTPRDIFKSADINKKLREVFPPMMVPMTEHCTTDGHQLIYACRTCAQARK